ncbi:circularly permuted type 2 ATP-grasp protein, partial [Acinetobacter baumannii]
LAAGTESRVALLTPGPLNETYFEHAYLARYLGFLLTEGADLTVRDDTLYIRTVSGLKRLEMVWRRLDADFADPLELN